MNSKKTITVTWFIKLIIAWSILFFFSRCLFSPENITKSWYLFSMYLLLLIFTSMGIRMVLDTLEIMAEAFILGFRIRRYMKKNKIEVNGV